MIFNSFNLVIILYMAIIFAIGIKASLKISKLSDFVLADRKLGGPITALAAGASDMSGWLLTAVPGFLFVYDLNRLWLPASLIVGAYLNWQFVAKRLRIYTELANNSLTIPTYFRNRFLQDDDKIRIVTSLVIVVFFTAYASANFVMCAKLAEQIFSISYLNALLISSSIMIIYTCLGGFLSVSWVDFFQGILMFVCLILVPTVVTYHLGGIDNITEQLSMVKIESSLFSDPISLISSIGWGLGYFGQVHILARFMAIRHHNELPVAKNICMIWMSIALLGAICCGLVGRVYYHTMDDPEMVYIRLALDLFEPWVSAVLVSAVLSAIMSTITAQILNAASSLVEDFYHKKFRRNAKQKELLWVARLFVIIIAVIAMLLALHPKGTILSLVGFAWSGMGASFGPVILVSLYWDKMTSKSAIYGMLLGAGCVLIWEYLADLHFIFKVNGIIPGFFLNLLTIYLISKFDKNLDNRMSEDFARMKDILKPSKSI